MSQLAKCKLNPVKSVIFEGNVQDDAKGREPTMCSPDLRAQRAHGLQGCRRLTPAVQVEAQ